MIEINTLLEKLEQKKREYFHKGIYEHAAWLRDSENRFFDKWLVAHWWDYSKLDVSQAKDEMNKLLTQVNNKT